MLLQWLPYLAKGFAMNVLISILAIAIGTFIGVVLGIMELAPYRIVRAPALTYVQIFRNAPHLVLIFAATYIFPFEIVAFGNYIPFRTGSRPSSVLPFRRAPILPKSLRRHPVHPDRPMGSGARTGLFP